MSACRGKLTEQAPERALGPVSDIFVPQKWFAHFYMAGCMCNGLALAWVSHQTRSTPSIDALIPCGIASCLLQIHLLRRLIETVMMMKYPKDAKMHVIAYIFGLSYYVVVPLTYCTSSDELHHRSHNLHIYMGAFIFIIGNVVQWHSHYVLSLLSRKGNGRYRIPRKGLFHLVSCPHYFGEIVIYLGLALMHVYGPLRAWYPFVWVIVNLILAARMTHSWYQSHFKTYPADRKMLIPYVY